MKKVFGLFAVAALISTQAFAQDVITKMKPHHAAEALISKMEVPVEKQKKVFELLVKMRELTDQSPDVPPMLKEQGLKHEMPYLQKFEVIRASKEKADYAQKMLHEIYWELATLGVINYRALGGRTPKNTYTGYVEKLLKESEDAIFSKWRSFYWDGRALMRPELAERFFFEKQWGVGDQEGMKPFIPVFRGMYAALAAYRVASQEKQKLEARKAFNKNFNGFIELVGEGNVPFRELNDLLKESLAIDGMEIYGPWGKGVALRSAKDGLEIVIEGKATKIANIKDEISVSPNSGLKFVRPCEYGGHLWTRDNKLIVQPGIRGANQVEILIKK